MSGVENNSSLQDAIMDHYQTIMLSGIQEGSLTAFKQSLGKENLGIIAQNGRGRTPYKMVWIMESFISKQIGELTFFEYINPVSEPQEVEPQEEREAAPLGEIFNSNGVVPPDGMELEGMDLGSGLDFDAFFDLEGQAAPNFSQVNANMDPPRGDLSTHCLKCDVKKL
jgi:hypothetical protein